MWTDIFSHDATLTSAVLDGLLHHAETIKIEGSSYRMKDRTAAPSEASDPTEETSTPSCKTPSEHLHS